jgi:quercetin dioxygenase-like cupin family protein
MDVGIEEVQMAESVEFKVTRISAHHTTLSGNDFQYLQTDSPEIVSHFVEIAPGGEVGRHKHPAPAFMYVMEGTLVVEQDDGTKTVHHAGDALLEDAGTWFNNKNPGDTPTKFLSVIHGDKTNPPVLFSEE